MGGHVDPVCWTEVGERHSMCPDLIKDTYEKVELIGKHLPHGSKPAEELCR